MVQIHVFHFCESTCIDISQILKRLTEQYQNIKVLTRKGCENIAGKGKKLVTTTFLSPLSRISLTTSVILHLHYTNAFSLDQFEHLLCLVKSKLLKQKLFENIVGKGENAGNQHFLLFPLCFLLLTKQIAIFIFLSVKSFRLEWSRILPFDKGLNKTST